MTNVTSDAPPEEPDDLSLTEFIEQLRRLPPRKGCPRKTIDEIIAEQGVGPINIERLMTKSPGRCTTDFEKMFAA